MQERVVNRNAMEPVVFDRTAQWDRAELVEALAAVDVPAGPISEFADVFADRQIQARGMVVEVDHPLGGRIKMLASPINYSETPITGYVPAPLQGQHTDELLRKILAADDERIAALLASGAI